MFWKWYVCVWAAYEAGAAAIPLTLELFTGARDAEVVLGCFVKSMASTEEGGLGLTLSMAVGLYKQNG